MRHQIIIEHETMEAVVLPSAVLCLNLSEADLKC